MAKKQYKYTHYRVNKEGTEWETEVIGPVDKQALYFLQKRVGGCIATVPRQCYAHHVPKNGRANAYCNDEGLMIGLPVNPYFKPFMGNVIVGNVIKEEVWKE